MNETNKNELIEAISSAMNVTDSIRKKINSDETEMDSLEKKLFNINSEIEKAVSSNDFESYKEKKKNKEKVLSEIEFFKLRSNKKTFIPAEVSENFVLSITKYLEKYEKECNEKIYRMIMQIYKCANDFIECSCESVDMIEAIKKYADPSFRIPSEAAEKNLYYSRLNFPIYDVKDRLDNSRFGMKANEEMKGKKN